MLRLLSHTRSELVLAAAAGLSLLAYLVLLTTVVDMRTAEPSYAGDLIPRVGTVTREAMARLSEASPRFLLLIGVLFVGYVLALAALRGCRSRAVELAVLAAGALFLLIQVVQPALLSTDVYAYTLYGRIFAVYQGDPYALNYFKYPDDPYTPLTYGLPWPSWYGPIWTLISAGLAQIGGERIGLTVLLFRLLAIASVFGGAVLILVTLRRLAPERAAQGVVFFLWNPLVVLESGMGAHNDAFVAFLLLAGIWLYVRGQRILPLIAFTASVLVKLVTGLILPLFVLLVLRQLPSWGARLHFLTLGAIAVGCTALVAFGLVRTAPLNPVASSAAASYFYDNNIYQIVFPQIRIWLGEDPDSATVPVHFYPWWGRTARQATLHREPNEGSREVERLRSGTLVLVTSPEPERWVRVYEVRGGERGYLQEPLLEKTERPHELANTNPRLGRLERNPATGPIAAQANNLLRMGVWSVFAAIYLLALWRTRDLASFFRWSAMSFLALYWLVATEFWPWYVVWALALAALTPLGRPAVLAALLSACVFTLYVTIGYERSAQHWLFTYRSLPALLLPLVLFAAWQLVRGAQQAFDRRPSTPAPEIVGAAPTAAHD